MSLPRGLVEAVRSGSVVPFVGAGISQAVTDTQGRQLFPSWAELLKRAAVRVRQEGKSNAAALIDAYLAQDEPDYLNAAKCTRSALIGSVWGSFLKGELRKEHRDAAPQSLALAERIWKLGSCLVITTNFDSVLRWACPNTRDLVWWNIEAPHDQILAVRDRIDRPTLWYLHGSVDDVDKVILVPESYGGLYEGSRYSAALEFLRIALLRNTFLFVGFSLSDVYFLRQLRWMRDTVGDCGGPHYALFEKSEASQVRRKVAGLAVEVVEFSGFGLPLISLLDEIGGHAARMCY